MIGKWIDDYDILNQMYLYIICMEHQYCEQCIEQNDSKIVSIQGIFN